MNQNITEKKELPAEVINAIFSGRKIEAIKLLRGEWNIDLKAAKETIDHYIDSDPVLKEKLLQKGSSGSLVWFIILILIAAVAFFLSNN